MFRYQVPFDGRNTATFLPSPSKSPGCGMSSGAPKAMPVNPADDNITPVF
ncbi:MAG: hypothetical protein ABI891_10895 [Acidobacteriota bacterium]